VITFILETELLQSGEVFAVAQSEAINNGAVGAHHFMAH